MSTELSFEWDSRGLAIFRGRTLDKALVRAMRLAGNQATRSLERDAEKFASSRKALSKQLIDEDIAVEYPRRGSSLDDFVWKVWARGKPVPASKFPHRDTRRNSRKGVVVAFGSSTSTIGGAFVATTKSGHLGVFRRRGDRRLPIDQVFSSRLPRKFGAEVVVTYTDKTYRKLESAFVRGLDRELGKLKAKGSA